jgi:hypothetical protein
VLLLHACTVFLLLLLLLHCTAGRIPGSVSKQKPSLPSADRPASSPGQEATQPEPEPELELERKRADVNRRTTDLPRHSLVFIWRKSAFVAATMVISLLQNLLVCGLFGRLRVQGDLPGLRTLMLYSFYISQCCGTAVVMVPVVKRILTARMLMVITACRLPLCGLIFFYNNQSTKIDAGHHGGEDLVFQSDWEVAIIYSFYMLAGGMIFSQAFSLSADTFEHAADRAVSATVMSVAYYAGVVLSSMIMVTD